MRKQICVLALVLLTGCGAPETVQSAPNTSDLEAAVEIPAAAALYQDAPLLEVWEEQVNAVERSTYIADPRVRTVAGGGNPAGGRSRARVGDRL